MGRIGQGAFGMQDIPQLARQLDTGQGNRGHLLIEHGARQHAPGQADGHHHLDGLQVVGAHRDVGCQALGFEQTMDDMVGKGITAREHRWMACNIGHAYGFLPGQAVLRGHHEIQRVIPYRYGANQ